MICNGFSQSARLYVGSVTAERLVMASSNLSRDIHHSKENRHNAERNWKEFGIYRDLMYVISKTNLSAFRSRLFAITCAAMHLVLDLAVSSAISIQNF